jgi:hypothetical protein
MVKKYKKGCDNKVMRRKVPVKNGHGADNKKQTI